MVETLRSTEYNLKWNSHHSTIISMMDYLLERESLTDVTLAAEGKFINVHRFMLFACSPYFEELLTQQTEKQAIIFLKDVSFANLQALVQFMYKGEVLVPEEQLGSFCQTAVSLKIKGLLFCDKEESIKVQSKPVKLQSEKAMPSSKKRAMSPQQTHQHDVAPKVPCSPSKSIKISSLHSIATVESAEHIETEEPEFIDMQEEIEFEEPIEKKIVTNRSEGPSFSGTLKQIDKTVEYVFAEKKQLKAHSSDTYESDPDAESEEMEASLIEYEKKWASGDDSNAQDDDLEFDYSQHEAYMNEDGERPSRQISRKSKSSLSNGKNRSRRYSPGTPMHVCGKCGRSYSYKGSLLNHMSECGKKS